MYVFICSVPLTSETKAMPLNVVKLDSHIVKTFYDQVMKHIISCHFLCFNNTLFYTNVH